MDTPSQLDPQIERIKQQVYSELKQGGFDPEREYQSIMAKLSPLAEVADQDTYDELVAVANEAKQLYDTGAQAFRLAVGARAAAEKLNERVNELIDEHGNLVQALTGEGEHYLVDQYKEGIEQEAYFQAEEDVVDMIHNAGGYVINDPAEVLLTWGEFDLSPTQATLFFQMLTGEAEVSFELKGRINEFIREVCNEQEELDKAERADRQERLARFLRMTPDERMDVGVSRWESNDVA